MTKVAAVLLTLLPCLTHAETLLCVAEAGAVVEDGGKDGIVAGLANVSQNKYIQTNESGNWVVKVLGENEPLFDKCKSQYFCERSEFYAGTFLRKPESGVFSIVWMTRKDGADKLVVAKGRCSSL